MFIEDLPCVGHWIWVWEHNGEKTDKTYALTEAASREE